MSAEPDVKEQLTVPIPRPEGSLDEQRRRRAEALKKIEGLWKDRTDIPTDGVEYQKQIRSEWP